MEQFKKILTINNLILFGIIITAVILRALTYSYNRPLWLDEASLSMSILSRGITDYMSPLLHVQSAPPLFMSITKMAALITGSYSEYILRLFPLVSGIFSIFAFVFLAKKVLDKKWSVLSASFLFAINFQLIYYSQEFKQYSSDVLFFMVSILMFAGFDFKTADKKHLAIFTAAAVILPYISLPTIFVIFSVLLIQLIKYKKQILHKFTVFVIPFILSLTFYYFKLLGPSKELMLLKYSELWDEGFVRLNLSSILNLIKVNFSFYFEPNIFILFELILVVWGIILFVKERKNHNNQIILLTLCLVISASFFHLYPIKLRVGLYLIPLMILFAVKPLDIIKNTKPFASACAVILFISAFAKYDLSYMKNFFNKDVFAKNDARATFQIMTQKIKQDDYIVYNPASGSLYYYYKSYFNFNHEKTIVANLPEYNEETYFMVLNSLPKGHNYWFYYPYDYNSTPVMSFLKHWKQDKNIVFEKEIKKSFIMYIKY